MKKIKRLLFDYLPLLFLVINSGFLATNFLMRKYGLSYQAHIIIIYLFIVQILELFISSVLFWKILDKVVFSLKFNKVERVTFILNCFLIFSMYCFLLENFMWIVQMVVSFWYTLVCHMYRISNNNN